MAVAESVEQQADSFVRSSHRLLIDGEWVEATTGEMFATFNPRASRVWINTYHVFDAAMPFGGYKESGWGREMGSQVLNNYLEMKSVVAAL